MNYEDGSGHPPDFEVSYRFYTHAEGGRHSGPPFQHYRCDWSYEGDDISRTGIYMIFPEFVSEEGGIVPEGIPVPVSGRATMWIVSHEMRLRVHRVRLKDGVEGFFMEGQLRVAEAVVTRILGLRTNSDARHQERAEQDHALDAQ